MSEPTTAPAAPPRGAKKPGKKILGLPMPVVLGVAAGGVALIYLWLRDRKSKTAATTATTSTTSSATDYGSELAELQSEIDELMADQGTGTTGTTTSTGTTSPTSTGTVVSTGPPPDIQKPANAPPGERTTAVTRTSAVLAWNKVDRASSYRVQAFATKTHEMVHDGTTSALTVSLSGLKGSTEYGWKCQAVNAAGSGPFSTTHHFTTHGALDAGGPPATGGTPVLKNG
jgi:hypothetical protein